MRHTFLSALAAAGLLAGCGGSSDSDSAVTPTAPAPSQAVDITQGAVTAPPAPDAGAPAAPVAAPVQVSESEPLGGKGRPLTQEEVMLLNYGISMFKEEKGRFPATLEEAVASRHISRLPQLPAGEKFAYDPQNGSVRVQSTN